MTPVTTTLRYDLRAPSFGPPIGELYSTMLDQTAWAEQHLPGAMVGLSEHHSSDDGYCPSPLVLAAAVTGRTSTIRVIVVALVAPLYHPVRLAEDLAVLDLVSGGRVDLVVGAGYVPDEAALYGFPADERVARLEEALRIMRAAWTGEPFEYAGQTVRVTPRPLRPNGPMLLLGGSTPASARRAARLADGYIPTDGELYALYEAECKELGRSPMGLAHDNPPFIHVSDDPETTWARLGPHALHESNEYAAWERHRPSKSFFTSYASVEQLRASGRYLIVTPDEAIAHVRAAGSLVLQPLMGGLPIDLSWESLELVADRVLPIVNAPQEERP